MPSLITIYDPPYLYEILYTGNLIQRITKHDADSPRFREVEFDDLSEEMKDRVVERITNE